jgi:hypothetical protein
MTLILATVALYLGIILSPMALGDKGWGTLLGWSIWLILVVLIMEFDSCVFGNNPNIGKFLTN